jgi:hypothetical protein
MRLSGVMTSLSYTNATPFGSLMPYAIGAEDGLPIIALNAGEIHARNVDEFARVSLVVHSLTPKNLVPSQVGVPFVQLVGSLIEHTSAPLSGDDAALDDGSDLVVRASPSSDPAAPPNERRYMIDRAHSAMRTFYRRFPQAEQHLVKPRFFHLDVETAQYGGRTLQTAIKMAATEFNSARVDLVCSKVMSRREC